MLPMLGLYADLYKERRGLASEAYSVIEPIKDRLYPKTFKYVHLVDGKERTVESPLFGDLIEAVELSVRLGEVDENDPLWKRPMPDFAPGTNAQRRAHKLRARGKSQEPGGAREVQLRRSFSTVFSSDLNSQETPERPRMPPRPSRSLEAEATQSTRGRPMLSRAMTWRASAPRLPDLEDEGDGVA